MDRPITTLEPVTKPQSAGQIGLWDAIGIIIGIVVGTAIFKSPTMVFQSVSGPYLALLTWLVGGLLSLMGAICYAELATTYPQSGGDYQYLRRAFGPWMGFLFGWAQLCVILTGSIAAMAYSFAEYFTQAFGVHEVPLVALAAAPVIVLSALNLFGAMLGKSTQNFLSIVKVLGLLAIIVVGFAVGSDGAVSVSSGPTPPHMGLVWRWSSCYTLTAGGMTRPSLPLKCVTHNEIFHGR